MADFIAKYKKLRTGNRRKVAMACSDSLQVGFHSGLLSRGVPPMTAYTADSARKGYLSQASGILKVRDLVEVFIWVSERAQKS